MRTRLTFVFAVMFLLCGNAQHGHKSVSFGVGYGNLRRTQLENYLKTLSDTFNLEASLQANSWYSLQGGFHSTGDKGEFYFGANYGITRSFVKASSLDNYVLTRTSNFGITIGGNYLPAPFLYMGSYFKINSFGGKTEQRGDFPSSVSSQLQSPPDDANFLRGYSCVLNLHAGFRIRSRQHIRDQSEGGARLEAFFEAGSRFNFYNAFDYHLANYSGSQKTAMTCFGVNLIFMCNLEE